MNLAQFIRRRTLPLGIFVWSSVVMFMHEPFTRVEGGDSAIYDYIAQSILRGQLPYRDVVDIKGPGSTYLSAMAMELGRVLGLGDVIAVRLLHVVMVGLLAVVTYLVAECYLRSRGAGLIAALIPLLSSRYADMMLGGTQPKLPMIILGMLALLMIAKEKPFWAGFCSMLSCLCWQPGLMFAGVAFLIFSRYATSWRDLRALKVLVGAAIPLAIVLLYFYWHGALSDLWTWTITYNYSTFGPEAKRPLGRALTRLWNVSYRILESYVVFVALSAVGLSIFCFERMRTKTKWRHATVAEDLFKDALAMPPLIYLVFCLINFQSGPDLIPLFPFIGIFAGWLFVKAGRMIGRNRNFKLGTHSLRARDSAPGLAIVVVMALVAGNALSHKSRYHGTLQDQENEAKVIASMLGPDDRIYVHGTVEILVLLNRPNLNPYVFLDWGQDDYAARTKYGGSFQVLVDEMESQAPKIVSISRLTLVAHRAELERWIAEHYDKLPLVWFEDVFIRNGE